MIYVDEIVDWGEVARAKGLRWTKWCHLVADSHEELMEMAKRLNLKSEWIQKPGTPNEHFDLIPTKRTLAIKHGAKAISCRELALMRFEKKDGLR